MAVDLFDLVEVLKRSVNQPGGDTFGASDEVYAGYLSDAFWEIRMLDMLSAWTEADGVIEPLDVSTGDLPRELQSLLVLYAAITIVTNELKNVETLFRAKAGPAEFETQKSGALLRDVLAELQRRRVVVEGALFEMGAVTDTYIDSVTERLSSQSYGDSWWIR